MHEAPRHKKIPIMNSANVITLTVNPGKATIGALHSERCMKLLRRKADVEGATLARRKSGALLRALFGATSISAARSRTLLALRILFGAYLIFHGVLDSGAAMLEAVFSMAAGGALILGVATRFVMTASALCFAIMSGMIFEGGGIPQTELLIALMSTALALSGPGSYSIDALLRHSIFRSIRRYETRKLMQRRFSYRAYQYADYI